MQAAATGSRVQLRVVDRGRGVPEGAKETIFAPFQRFGDAPRGTGVGLGLAVARGLMEAMGGSILAEDTPGGGLTIVIELPRHPGHVAPRRRTRARWEDGPVSSILVVDDEPHLCRTLAINLRARDYAVETAGDGRTALQSFHDAPPDLVVLDLGLPDLDGVEVLRRVRQVSDVPVIVLSARTDSVDKVEALDLGADDYVTKPFAMDELLARVRVALRRRDDDGGLVRGAGARHRTSRSTSPSGGLWPPAHEVRLTPTEWSLLEVLARRPGHLVSQRDLLREVWGPGYGRESNYLRVYANQLRRKLEPDPASPRYLVTEPGQGYRLVVPD